jgi:hypothetical protein
MVIQYFTVISLVLYAGLLFAAYKAENTKLRIGLVCLVAGIFLVNPIKFKQEGVSSIERFSTKSVDIPDKVLDNRLSFEEKQESSRDKLKNESEEVLNEAIN